MVVHSTLLAHVLFSAVVGNSSCNPPQVADRWQAPQALAAIGTELCSLQPTVFPTSAVYDLPLGLHSTPSFAKVFLQAELSLLAVFGDTTAVATCRTLVGSFVSLPRAAVLALLQSQALVTDAEATVLLLLSEWCDGDRGKACSETELLELNGFIRYSCVSTTYLTDLYKTLHTPPLTLGQRMELLHIRSLPQPSRDLNSKYNMQDNPTGWYLGERGTLGGARQANFSITLKIAEAELHQLVRATKLRAEGGSLQGNENLSSTRVYAHGFWWVVSFSGTTGAPWCGFQVRGVSSLLITNAGAIVKHGIMCDYTLTIRRDLTELVHDSGMALPITSRGIGCEFSAREGETLGPLDVQWWEPYIVEGYLTVTASVSNVLF